MDRVQARTNGCRARGQSPPSRKERGKGGATTLRTYERLGQPPKGARNGAPTVWLCPRIETPSHPPVLRYNPARSFCDAQNATVHYDSLQPRTEMVRHGKTDRTQGVRSRTKTRVQRTSPANKTEDRESERTRGFVGTRGLSFSTAPRDG